MNWFFFSSNCIYLNYANIYDSAVWIKFYYKNGFLIIFLVVYVIVFICVMVLVDINMLTKIVKKKLFIVVQFEF